MDIVLKLKLDDKEYDAKIVDADKQLAALRKQTQSVGDAMGKWGQIVTGFNQALELSGRLFSSLKEKVLAGADLQVLRDNFKGTADDIERFRVATARTVSEANLIKLSNQASELGLSLKDQVILFALAENSADKFGGKTEDNFMKIIQASEGMGKGLRSLGIQTAIYNQTVERLAKAQGDKIENLDAETQKQIRLQAIIQSSNITLEDAISKTQDNADKLAGLNIEVDEAREKMGLWLSEQLIPLVDLLGKSEKGTFGLRDAVIALTGSMPDLIIAFSGLKYLLGGKNLGTLGTYGGYAALSGLIMAPMIDAVNNRNNPGNTIAGRIGNSLIGFGSADPNMIGTSVTTPLNSKEQIQQRIREINEEIKKYDKTSLQYGTLNQERSSLYNRFNNLIAGGGDGSSGSTGNGNNNKSNDKLLKEQEEFQKKLIELEKGYLEWVDSITAGSPYNTIRRSDASVKGFRTSDAGARYNVNGKTSASDKKNGAELAGVTDEYQDKILNDAERFNNALTGVFDNLWSKILDGSINDAQILNNIIDSIFAALAENLAAMVGKQLGTDIVSLLMSIPFLAEGAIVTKPTLAMIGEGGEREAVIPLSKLDRYYNNNGNVERIIEAYMQRIDRWNSDLKLESEISNDHIRLSYNKAQKLRSEIEA